MNNRQGICKYRNLPPRICMLQRGNVLIRDQFANPVLEIIYNTTPKFLTKDSLVKKIQDVQNTVGYNQSLDQRIQISQIGIMQILKKRCTELKDFR